MKFVLVNHEPPSSETTCSACSRSIGAGYLRHVQTQRRYCDYDCYRRGEFATLLMPWPIQTQLTAGNIEVVARNMIEMSAVLSAVSCWSSTIQMWTFARALTGAYLNGRELIAEEGGDT
jgi:hypothetical protein